DMMHLTVNPAPTINFVSEQSVCDYEVPVSFDAGSGYSYNWNTGETSQFIFTSETGEYSVTITDNNGCTTSDTTVLIVNSSPEFDLGSPVDVCDYNAPYTIESVPGMDNYLWSNGEHTETIDVNATGSYILTVTNDNGCTSSDNKFVNIHNPPAINLGPDQSVCETETPIELNAGSAELYAWNTGSNEQYLEINSTGNYSVTIADQYGCTNSDNVIVNVDAMPNATIVSDPHCCIDDDEFTLLAMTSGGTWSGIGITDADEGTFSPAIAGIGSSQVLYTITQGECTALSGIQIQVHGLPPVEIVDLTSPLCHGDANGSITVSSPGTTEPNFTWPNVGYGPEINDLIAGDYTVIVEDAYGCKNTEDIVLDEPAPVDASFSNIDHVSCYGGSDGSATIVGTGGTPPIKYYWNTGWELPTLPNVEAGEYTVSVIDYHNCMTVKSVQITEPEPLTVNETVSHVQCGQNGGSITLNPSGGTPAYNINWSHPGFEGTEQTNLPQGTYVVSIQDANGCTVNANMIVYTVGNIDVNINEINSIECQGDNDGQLHVYSTDAVEPTEIMWNTGNTNDTISDLYPAIYSATISDALGCTGNDNHNLTSPEPIEIHFITESVTCHGDNDGMAVAIPTGGTWPYQFNWEGMYDNDTISNMPPGNYDLTVTDANNCTAKSNVYIPEPAPLNANILHHDITCYGYHDGKALAEAYGGTEPYDYLWSFNGLTSHNNELSNLGEGNYDLHIEDEHGCAFDTSLIITQPPPLVVDYTYENPSCIANDDGSVEFEVSGGTPPYNYNASMATQNLPYFEGLSEGNYSFTITDANGCSQELETIVLIDNPVDCIKIPDAFTPNGDNVNDTWIIENIEMFPNHVVQVFNRWGQVVYFKKYGNEPWDGTYRDTHRKVPTGPYVYVVDLHNGMEEKTGTVTVIY
ncbi:MAG: gliding motility-associated C-terminal domain-containing protein, partial [Bacteroidota bacterium]|nr:gliding motility-associated C-terminal domain-containing protein [Bacteroidota bacterium]